MSAQPIRLFFSELTGRVYASRAYRDLGNGAVEITGQKFDVTDQVATMAQQLYRHAREQQ